MACEGTWVSMKGRRVPWTHEHVISLAEAIIENMPKNLVNMLLDGKLRPGPIVELQAGGQYGVSASDVVGHQVYLGPLVKAYPAAAPSSFLLADVLLAIDEKLDGKFILRPEAGDKKLWALQDASRLKRLIQHLRYLYRATPDSHDPGMKKLKSHLEMKSPTSSPTKSSSSAASDATTLVMAGGDSQDLEGFGASAVPVPEDAGLHPHTLAVLGLPGAASRAPPPAVPDLPSLPSELPPPDPREQWALASGSKRKQSTGAATFKTSKKAKKTQAKNLQSDEQEQPQEPQPQGPQEPQEVKTPVGEAGSGEVNPLFEESYLESLGFPEEALPDGSHGKYSYTKKGYNPSDGLPGARIEVNMRYRHFRVQAVLPGMPALGSGPNFAWRNFSSVQEAWDHVKEVSGWTPWST